MRRLWAVCALGLLVACTSGEHVAIRTPDVATPARVTRRSATPSPSPTRSAARPRHSAAASSSPTPGPSTNVSGTSTATAVADCADGDLRARVWTSKSTYARGEHIPMKTRLTNASSHPCGVSASSCADGVWVTDAQGSTVWSSTMPGAAMCIRPARYALAPGGSVTYTFTWDQHACTPGPGCPGAQVPSESYELNGAWGAVRARAYPFTIEK